jgi:hypothetical protein
MIVANDQPNADFRHTTADAHRVMPIDFDPPALICHQAFWIAPRTPQSELGKKRESVKEAIDDLFLATARYIKSTIDADVRIETRVGESAVLFSKIANAKTLAGEGPIHSDANKDIGPISYRQRAVQGVIR